MIDHEMLWSNLRSFRRDLHENPEFGFDEHRTSGLVAARLRACGFTDIEERVGGTGVIARLRSGTGPGAIALRADMDCLHITEAGEHAHRSTKPGLMHACGHDGHTVMLLGAAEILAAERGFDGSVVFIFQPAEEWGKGARAMLDGGLRERFPYSEIYGLHNLPGLAAGKFATRAGPAMSAEDNFEIVLRGVGGHAARPHSTNEVLVAACTIVTTLQTIVARRLDPIDTAVVSVTELTTDGTRNVLPGEARILGDARSFRPQVSGRIEEQMRAIASGIASAYNCEATVDYQRSFVSLQNDPAATTVAVRAASTVFGAENVDGECDPITASEDFAQFLADGPGNFGFIGNGEHSPPLHNPLFDFNDEVIPLGVQYFVELAKQRLPTSAAD